MKRLFTSLLILFMVGLAVAQNSEPIVQLKLFSSVDKMERGESYDIALQVKIKPPFHINSDKPNEDFLIPTTVSFEVPEGVSVGKVRFPEAELKKFEFSETPLAVFENTFYVYTTLTISPDFSGDQIAVGGTFGYQACDNHTCQPPTDVIFKELIPLAKAGESVALMNQEIFTQKPQEKAAVEATAGESDFAKTVEEKGLFITFILVFLGGLALNLTPCVYPLIPITISYFGGQNKGNVVTHAILYVLGMAITYSVLGVIAALTGSMFGAALQNPIVLIIIALVLVGLSLSMFDLYEIRVPAFLSNFAGGARQGYFGTFFMGLTVGIVAAPCIGPFVLALLTYVGEKGSVFLGFWLFFVLAMGLGVPFLFLGIFSGSINKLPRSGAWMIWVRSIFGFILLAMAAYFLAPLFPSELYYHLSLAFIMLLGGIYMAWIEPTPAQGKAFPIIRNLVGVVFFILALVFTAIAIDARIDEKLADMKAAGAVAGHTEGIAWQHFSDELLQQAAAEGKPVMIDFFADWCIPCKELDKFTFSKPEVIEMSKNFVMMKVDLTKANTPENIALKERFQIKGVPTLVFITPDGVEHKDKRVVGFMEAEEFLPILQAVLDASH
ncbi:MAG: protein-disulfide reductase DsbD [Calditrichia bacterium]